MVTRIRDFLFTKTEQGMAAITSEPISKKSRWLWFCTICIVVVGIDQWMKQYALVNWQGVPPRSFFYDIFRIQFAPNPGAFLGLFGNLPDHVRFIILTVLNGVILAGVSAYILFGKNVSKYIFIAFALVVAGQNQNKPNPLRERQHREGSEVDHRSAVCLSVCND